MKLGIFLGYWSAVPPPGAAASVRLADELGFDSFWTAEAYGSDALSPLAWWGARTENLRLGTGIMQLSARAPAATAMAAITMDHLSEGRFILGLGVSGPQVVEGWYGQPYPKPLARTREYVQIIRDILARDEPVTADGVHYPLPYQGGTGQGKALRSTVHPLREDLPIFLGAEGPKNIALAAEIGDGWLPLFFTPEQDGYYRDRLAEGFAVPGSRRGFDDFEVAAPTWVVPVEDVDAAAMSLKPMLALYIGGMGSRENNFHRQVFERMGYEQECEQITTHYLDGDRNAAFAAVTTEMVQEVALIGSWAKIKDDLARWDETVVTTLLISGPDDLLRKMAELTG